MRLWLQPVATAMATNGTATEHKRTSRETIAALSGRVIRNLLARLKTRPTVQAGARYGSNRNRGAERVFVVFQVSQSSSWLSTQVYTPFDRRAGQSVFFSFFLKLEPANSAVFAVRISRGLQERHERRNTRSPNHRVGRQACRFPCGEESLGITELGQTCRIEIDPGHSSGVRGVASQILNVVSPAVTSSRPSGLNATLKTNSECRERVSTDFLVTTAQSLMLPSSPDEVNVRPSGAVRETLSWMLVTAEGAQLPTRRDEPELEAYHPNSLKQGRARRG